MAQPEYFKAVMTIVWRAKSGQRHIRRVDLGHVRADGANFDALAVLNIGMRGDVVSYTVASAA